MKVFNTDFEDLLENSADANNSTNFMVESYDDIINEQTQSENITSPLRLGDILESPTKILIEPVKQTNSDTLPITYNVTNNTYSDNQVTVNANNPLVPSVNKNDQIISSSDILNILPKYSQSQNTRESNNTINNNTNNPDDYINYYLDNYYSYTNPQVNAKTIESNILKYAMDSSLFYPEIASEIENIKFSKADKTIVDQTLMKSSKIIQSDKIKSIIEENKTTNAINTLNSTIPAALESVVNKVDTVSNTETTANQSNSVNSVKSDNTQTTNYNNSNSTIIPPVNQQANTPTDLSNLEFYLQAIYSAISSGRLKVKISD